VGRTEDAIRLHEENLDLMRSRLRPDHPLTLLSAKNLAVAYEAASRLADAERLYYDVIARRRKLEKPDGTVLAGDLAQLGDVLLKQAKWWDAEPLLRECLAIREKVLPDVWSRFNTMSHLGGALLGQGRYEEAEPLVIGGYEGMRARDAKIPPPAKPRLREAAERVVRLYQAWNKPENTNEWKVKLGLADLPAEVFARP